MKIKGHAIRSTTAPSKPQAPSISSVSDTSITILWPANSEPNITGYNIHRSTDGSTYTVLVTDWATNSYTDTNLTSGQIYYYRIGSKNSTGQVSEFSIVVSQETTTTGELTWSQALPSTIEFTYGVAGTFDFDPYISGTPASISVQTGQLPPNVTIVNETLSYDGGGSSEGHQETGVSFKINTSAEEDWQSRISDSSVVWYHDFRNAAEVSQFAWTGNYGSGNDPNMVNSGPGQGTNTIRQISDGPTGYCMEVFHPAGIEPSTTWWRPFTPFSSGNGRGVADPGAGVTLRTWSPTNGGNQTASWAYGYYGHPSNGTFDGHDFYIQVRVKMDPRRITGGNQNFSVGKQVWFTLCERSLTSQEHVFYSYGPGGNQGTGKNYLRCYTNAGGNGGSSPLDQYNSDGRIQHGSTEAADFYYSGGWDCILYHVRVGQQGVASGANAMKLEVWAATEAQILAGQGYTLTTKKIWNQEYPMLDFEGSDPSKYALQALILSSYNNGDNFPQDFYHRYTQVIFSKAFIQCPQI